MVTPELSDKLFRYLGIFFLAGLTILSEWAFIEYGSNWFRGGLALCCFLLIFQLSYKKDWQRHLLKDVGKSFETMATSTLPI